MNRLSIALLLMVAFAAAAEEHPLDLAQKAASAYAAERYAEAADLYARVAAANPRSAGARLQAARSLARLGESLDALQHLGAVVDLGLRFDPNDPAWSALEGDPHFQRLTSRMRAITAPLVRSTVAFRLEKELIPENVAWDPETGAFFVGSMYKAKIIRIGPDGSVTDFVPSRRHGLLSVLGMKIDPLRRELWAAAGNFGDRPPMEAEDPASVGKGALFRFDLDRGTLIRAYPAPGGTPEEPFQFNDLVLTAGGDVYATAGGHGIWVLKRGADRVEEFVAPARSFFNGIAITPDGATLFAASHFEGVMKIDLATKSVSLLDLPLDMTLGGIDGLYVHDGSLVAIQNGTNPARVVRAWLDPEMRRVTRFSVLEQEHPESDLPLTGTIVGDELYYIGRSQLRAFDGKRIWPPHRLKETTILRLPLEIAAAPSPYLEAEKASLLEMHRGEIRAHLDLDAGWIAEGHGDEFVSASGGKIHRMSRADALAFFTRYFEGASYPQYEDAEPPIVRVSDDGSMGWVLSRTRVRRLHDGTERSFVYAGIMVYEKRDGRWIRVANASTFE